MSENRNRKHGKWRGKNDMIDFEISPYCMNICNQTLTTVLGGCMSEQSNILPCYGIPPHC